jgi:antitoxin component YwqK of YwqJK toxin-antitoxin module
MKLPLFLSLQFLMFLQTLGQDTIFYNSDPKKIHGLGLYNERQQQIGEWKYFYESGELQEVSTFLNGRPEGKTKGYHENQRLRFTGRYSNGKQTGTWKQYYQSGELSTIGNYEHGEKVGPWKNMPEGKCQDNCYTTKMDS